MKRRRLRSLAALPLVMLLGATVGASPGCAANKPLTTLPFHLVGNTIVLPVHVASSDSLWFILDTGAFSAVVQQPVAERLGLPTTRESEAHGAGGTVSSRQLAPFEVKIGDIALKVDHASTFPLAGLSPRMGHPVDGIVGSELFRRYVVEVDYAVSTIRLYEPGSYRYQGDGQALGLTYTHNLPYVNAKIELSDGRKLEGRFVIDTGSNQSVILVPAFAQKENVAKTVAKTIPVAGLGVGGEVESNLGRLAGLELGRLRLREPLVTLPPPGGRGDFAVEGSAGNLGGAVLRKFRAIFDYPHNQMILETTGNLDEPVPFDASGLMLVTSGAAFDTVLVTRVIPGSPADEAGLLPGDGILSIDDVPVGTVGVLKMRERLRQGGATVRLAVSRKDRVWTVPLQLRPII